MLLRISSNDTICLLLMILYHFMQSLLLDVWNKSILPLHNTQLIGRQNKKFENKWKIFNRRSTHSQNIVLHCTVIVLKTKALRPPTKTILDDAISCKVQHLHFREIRLAINIQGFNILLIIDNRYSVRMNEKLAFMIDNQIRVWYPNTIIMFLLLNKFLINHFINFMCLLLHISRVILISS